MQTESPDNWEPYYQMLERLGIEDPDAPSGVGPGWVPLVERTILRLREIGWRGEIRQIKEKWGTLRIYVDHDLEATSEEIRRQADRIIAEAERESGAICEVCGQPGRTDGPPTGMSGPVLTLCEPHRRVYYYTG